MTAGSVIICPPGRAPRSASSSSGIPVRPPFSPTLVNQPGARRASTAWSKACSHCSSAGLTVGVVSAGPRLRQVAIVARDCGRVADEVRPAFGWPPPFHDPGVGQFGLTNAVFAVGDTFVEVVAPTRPDTAASRYLARRGGEGGYMAIFQVPDLGAARRLLADLGVRVVWTADLPDMGGTPPHPNDPPRPTGS